MRIVWDERKRRLNLIKHGYDFADLTEEFFETAVISESIDQRMVAVDLFEGAWVAVVFKPLGTEAISIISMHRTRYRND